jgi:hypothetical protein
VGYPAAEGNLWLLDTQTGSLAWCVQSKSVNDVPTCSPWAETPGDEAAYRWDPDAKKLIPLNDAARKKERQTTRLASALNEDASPHHGPLKRTEKNMGYRLGWTLYWVCLVLIAMYAMFWLAVLQGSTWETIRSDLSNWLTVLAVSSPVLILYGLGRGFRYVLSGE